MQPLIELHYAEILALTERHGIRDLRVLGSIANGHASDTSDVDLLMSLPPDRTPIGVLEKR